MSSRGRSPRCRHRHGNQAWTPPPSSTAVPVLSNPVSDRAQPSRIRRRGFGEQETQSHGGSNTRTVTAGVPGPAAARRSALTVASRTDTLTGRLSPRGDARRAGRRRSSRTSPSGFRSPADDFLTASNSNDHRLCTRGTAIAMKSNWYIATAAKILSPASPSFAESHTGDLGQRRCDRQRGARGTRPLPPVSLPA